MCLRVLTLSRHGDANHCGRVISIDLKRVEQGWGRNKTENFSGQKNR